MRRIKACACRQVRNIYRKIDLHPPTGPLWIRVVSPVVAISGEFFVLSCPISGWPRGFSSIVWEKGKKISHHIPTCIPSVVLIKLILVGILTPAEK